MIKYFLTLNEGSPENRNVQDQFLQKFTLVSTNLVHNLCLVF